MESSGIPKSRQFPVKLKPDAVDYNAFCELADIRDNIVRFINEGKNLYICGAHTGNGKTSWAIKLLTRYFDSIWAGNGFKIRGLMIHVPSFLMQLKDFDDPLSNDYKQTILTTDVVIWDDIAHSDASKFDYNQLLTYVDNRFFTSKSNIFTSNIISEQELQKCLGGKLASRIWQFSKIIEFKGKDKRG